MHMKSIQNQYNQLLEGNLSQVNFMRAVRMTFPQYVTNVTSFTDSVKILKNKGLLSEELNKFGKFAKAKSEAMKLSKEEGKKKYVEQGPNETFIVSDLYDSKKTIVSFENGKFLSGNETLDETNTVGEETTVNEALNKDIKAFGQDLDKRFKEAGFDTLILMQNATQEQLNIVKTNPKAVLFQVSQTPETQTLLLNVNPTMVDKAESIVNRFQLSDYKGPVLKKGWTSKQVQGAINPGDIVNQKMDHSRGEWYFYRLAKVSTTVKNVTESKKQEFVANPVELTMGIKAEMGHTGDVKKAAKIAIDHLKENPSYYSQLKLSGIDSYQERPKAKAKSVKSPKKDEFVDKENGMKVVKEARLNMFPGEEPNDTVKQAAQFIEMNNTLKPFSDKFTLQNIGRDSNRAVLRYGYWEKLPSTLLEKFKLQFNIEEDVEEHDDRLPTTAYILTPSRQSIGKVDVGAAFEKFKATLENIVREVLKEENSK